MSRRILTFLKHRSHSAETSDFPTVVTFNRQPLKWKSDWSQATVTWKFWVKKKELKFRKQDLVPTKTTVILQKKRYDLKCGSLNVWEPQSPAPATYLHPCQDHFILWGCICKWFHAPIDWPAWILNSAPRTDLMVTWCWHSGLSKKNEPRLDFHIANGAILSRQGQQTERLLQGNINWGELKSHYSAVYILD